MERRSGAGRLPPVDRFHVLVARLKPDSYERAQELLAEYPSPIAEGLEGVDRNAIFLSANEVIFLFEGEGANESVRAKFNTRSARPT
jgi:hypothetical protein